MLPKIHWTLQNSPKIIQTAIKKSTFFFFNLLIDNNNIFLKQKIREKGERKLSN